MAYIGYMHGDRARNVPLNVYAHHGKVSPRPVAMVLDMSELDPTIGGWSDTSSTHGGEDIEGFR